MKVKSECDYQGLYLYDSEGNELSNNTISECDSYGLDLYDSDGNELRNNTISDCNYQGLYLYNSDGNELSNNTISECDYGLYLHDSDGNELSNNTISECDSYGLRLRDSEGNELSNNTISECDSDGLYLYYSDENELSNNTISDCNYQGLCLYDSDGNELSNNTISECNDYGLLLHYSDGNELRNNTISECDSYGLYLYGSDGNELRNNTMENNEYNFCDDGDELNNDIDSSNHVDGKSIYYLVNESDISEDYFSNAGTVYLINCSNVTVRDQTLKNNYYGISLINTNNSIIENNSVNQNRKGINVYESSYNNLTGNTVNNSGAMGLHLYNSSYNTVSDNVITYSECVGLRIEGCYNNLTGNNVSFNDGSGIVISDSDSHNTIIENNVVNDNDCNGIRVKGSDNYVAGNTVCNNEDMGIFVGTCDEPGNNTVIENTVSNNFIGIGFRYLFDSEVTGNTVTDNGIFGIILSESENLTLQRNIVKSNGYLEEGEEEYLRASLIVNSDEKEECSKHSEEPGIVKASYPVVGESMDLERAGIYLEDSSKNYLISNTVENNSDSGLCLSDSSNNTIYDNYFNNINNTGFAEGFLVDAREGDEEEINIWSITKTTGLNIIGGPYLGGNFWALPNGNGFSQTAVDTDGDGICESAYSVTEDAENIDYFPLTAVHTSKSVSSSSPNYIPAPMSSSTGNIDATQTRVSAGIPTKVELSNPKNDVFGIGFESKQYSGTVVVRVGDSDGSEAANSGELGGKVYKHMNIQLGNERFESSDNINGAYIEFRVSKSWVEENGIDPATITLNRNHDEAWNSLSTKMTGEDEEFYTFRAETPGFSLYAITGEEKETGVSAVTRAITPGEEEGTETILGEEQETDEKSESTPGFGTLFAALGILGSAFIVRKERRQN